MTPEQEQEVVAGLLPVSIGEAKHLVPELSWRANDEWQDTLRETFVRLAGVEADDPQGHKAMFHAELDLVRAYDRTGVLPLDDATAREIHAIYEQFVEVSFPLADSVTALMVSAITAAVKSVRESLANSPSPIGTSPIPAAPSPIAKSSSTSTRRKSGSRRSSAVA